MTLQKNATPSGRRTTKFTPENIQKIKDWVAEGISREEIAKLIDVTVGSLQVTCSRLGISLRTRQYSNGRGSHWEGAVGRPHLANHPPMIGHMRVDAQFQISFERGGERHATAVPLTARDIAQLALAAAVRNVGMTQLLTEVVTTAIQKDMIEEIYVSRPRTLLRRRCRKARNRVGAPDILWLALRRCGNGPSWSNTWPRSRQSIQPSLAGHRMKCSASPFGGSPRSLPRNLPRGMFVT